MNQNELADQASQRINEITRKVKNRATHLTQRARNNARAGGATDDLNLHGYAWAIIAVVSLGVGTLRFLLAPRRGD